MTHWILCIAAVAVVGAASAGEMPTGKALTNSLGMELVRIEAGQFVMGGERTPLPLAIARYPARRTGDPDEKPVHRVTLSRAFYMAVTEVTNAQYEQFDPRRRELRGKLGFSRRDDEAVVFVSWHDAAGFCEWLSRKEGRPYRLPTEAEWEYACRAGTTTPYHTGEALPKAFHKNPKMSWFPDPGRSRKDEVVPLSVGQTPPNPWGLHDMHGNVEEWCLDWYGPYLKHEPSLPISKLTLDGTIVHLDHLHWRDPVGYADGDFRVTRGGSHSTELFYLRSANRAGALPEDRSWLIGFRVVLGEMPTTKPLPRPPLPLHQRNVSQEPADWSKRPDPEKPCFAKPRVYVKIPPGPEGPMFSQHNHDPALVWCPNGDILAIWYSCVQEPGRELSILASRLRRGADAWEPASVFWDAPDRNDHAPAMWHDGKGTLYHFNGLSAAATWGNLATVLRTSTDSGATWSCARVIMPEHGTRHMPIESVFRLSDGTMLLPCDAVTGGSGGTAVHLSRDGGTTWRDAGGTAAGIHAGVVELTGGRLMALGRGDNVDGRMPKSLSADQGKTWTVTASPFPPISSGQRLALLRLREGPILLISSAERIGITDAAGQKRPVSGLFAALSRDDGETWDVRKAVAPDAETEVESFDGRRMAIGPARGEPRGYMSICQTPDGVIHLISSRLYYAFNLKWLQTPPSRLPAPPPPPKAEKLPVRGILPNSFRATALPSKAPPPWRFTGSGVSEADAVSFPRPGVMKIDAGRGQRARWADLSKEGFASVDPKLGFTAGIRMQVVKSTAGNRGIDFEAYVGDGSARGRRYFLTVTRTGLYWHDDGFRALAEGLDNHSAMHSYRISVRPDGIAQIYRDGTLLGIRPASRAVDAMLTPRGPYLQWGEGAGGSEADALVEHVAYDLSGPWAPPSAQP